jgi:hypothetical protein
MTHKYSDDGIRLFDSTLTDKQLTHAIWNTTTGGSAKATHWLMISAQFDERVSIDIRQRVYGIITKKLHHVRYSKRIADDDEDIAITWKRAHDENPMFYILNTKLADEYVSVLTNQALNIIKEALKTLFST